MGRRRRSLDASPQYDGRQKKTAMPYAPILARLQYLCELLFAGDTYVMSDALGLYYRKIYQIIRGKQQLPMWAAAQIVARLGVRGDWLLTGVGPVFSGPAEATSGFTLPPTLHSVFPLFEPVTNQPGVPAYASDHTEEPPVPDELPEPYLVAARAVFHANAQNAPVALFLGADNQWLWHSAAADLFRERYLHFLLLSLSAAKRDLRTVLHAGKTDLNHLARLAAQAGIGYGEAIGRWAFDPDSPARQTSTLAAAYDVGVPVVIRAEIGETFDHWQPAYPGAELGAAIGAAAYVDHLVFAQYFDAFWLKKGGVIICAGEPGRWLPVVRKVADMHGADFTLVLLNAVPVPFDVNEMTHLGATVVDIQETQPVFFSQLLRACRRAYASGGGSEGSSG